jgi:GR25 family glycosyltransferase involved in LPS biosynthesis
VPMTSGEIGCAMSHIQLWRKVEESGMPFALILEDDVVLDVHFASAVHRLRKQLPCDWDVLYLDYLNGCHPVKFSSELYRAIYVWHTGAYFVSQPGAKKLLKHLPVDCPVDNFMAKLILLGVLKAYLPTYPLALQSAGDSNIEHSHTSARASMPHSGPSIASSPRTSSPLLFLSHATQHHAIDMPPCVAGMRWQHHQAWISNGVSTTDSLIRKPTTESCPQFMPGDSKRKNNLQPSRVKFNS